MTSEDILIKAYHYGKNRRFMGYDLFDGLNSRLLKKLGLFKSRTIRLMAIQFFKRSPVNLRPLFLVPKGFNVKGGALFLMAALNLHQATGKEEYAQDARQLVKDILSRTITTSAGKAFGYNFDWQARAFFVPQGTPNAVTTVFTARALAAFDQQFPGELDKPIFDHMAAFFLNDMIHFETNNALCFNYIPGKDAEVHNANLLVAAFLAEYYKGNAPENLKNSIKTKIEKAVRFSVRDMAADGAWPYGTKSFHRWIDNFHTAYNIESLLTINRVFPELNLTPAITLALTYYLTHLFSDNGTPKYYSHALYPIDCHVLAETKILLNRLKTEKREWYDRHKTRIEAIETANTRLIHDFFNRKKGCFHYLKTRYYRNKIPYIRWCQAWMTYALSTDLRPKLHRT